MPDFFAEISKVATSWPHSLALISKSGNLDYRTLVETIESIAGQAISHGLTGGRIVHVETDNDDMRLLLFLGLMRAGLTVALLQSAGRALIETGVTPDSVITDRAGKSALAQRAKLVVRFSRDWFRPDGRNRTPLPDSPDYSLIYASSGSTGGQKLIMESRHTVEFLIGRRLKEPMFQENVRFLPSIGEASHGTFPHYLVVLSRGGSIVRLNEYSPETIVSATCLLRPSYAKLAPMILVKVLQLLDSAPRKFRKADYLRLAGAHCAAAIRMRAKERYAEHVLTGYGSTEIDQIAGGEFVADGHIEGSVGWIRDGMIVETIDDNGNRLPQGSEGEIRIKPPAQSVTRYVTRDGPVDVLTDGWFYPGDTGRVDPSGQLIITGRKSAVINLGGNKISPEAAESVLLGIDGIEDVAVAGVVGEHGFQAVCALVVTKKALAVDDINRFLAGNQARFLVEKLKVVAEIPRNTNRKIDRPTVQGIANSA